MPPKGYGGGTGGGGESALGSAARSGADAPYATAVATFLPAELISAFRELPRHMEALVPLPIQRGAQRVGARAVRRVRPSQVHALKGCLKGFAEALRGLPNDSPDHAASLAELLSQEPRAAAALLRTQAATLRPGQSVAIGVPGAEVHLLLKASPLPASAHGLSALRFVRAMLRAQPFHALSRQPAAAAAALEAGRSGGGAGSSGGDGGGGSSGAGSAGAGGEADGGTGSMFLADSVLSYSSSLLLGLDGVLGLGRELSADNFPPALAAEAAAERAACIEEFARGLAESGLLEHAARLMLQTRLVMHLRLTDCGERQTAVLVYGVGTLRVADRGPSYGLPAELQTAGLALLSRAEDGNRSLSPFALELLLRQLASGSTLPPPGPSASQELALRVGRVAVGTAGAASSSRPSAPLAMPVRMDQSETAVLAAGALSCGRLLLPLQRPSPRLEAQRAEWWRLAESAVAVSTFGLKVRTLWGLMTEPIMAMWPDGRLDLDALPRSAPPEVAAALGANMLHKIGCMVAHVDRSLNPYGAVCMTALLDACDATCPDGAGLALFLTPLLAYGDTGKGTKLVAELSTMERRLPAAADREPLRQAAGAFLRAVAEALGRCRGLGPDAEAAAGPVEAAEGSAEPAADGTASAGAGQLPDGEEPPPSPLQQLQRLLAPMGDTAAL
ncbi:hypothetical protein HYH03_011367 [Edaphochlamys debaryana]|uniref:Uncharacterized protein n=1 Tax=Edaphochlamys debaryana TaxID=47281 RepID=A0A836BWK6_9CHLO|nr:hypothetical protein HYH03_011367 [Edaphochlamys debaryana]|eukprot:KAG2490243.1 hypothetical protein HYH03_011367 [Edaphochlamys debaryana]